MAKSINIALLFANSILIIPILLTTWGAEKYGLWLTMISISNLLLALDNGHSTYIANEFNKFYHTNEQKAKELLGSSLRICYLSGLLQLLILSILLFSDVLNNLFESDVEPISQVLIGLIFIAFTRFVIGSARTIIVRTIQALGLVDRTFYIKSGTRLIEFSILVIAGFLEFSIYQTCILFAASHFIYSVIVLFLVKRWNPEYFPWWRYGSIRLGLKNYIKSLALTLNTFVERFSSDGVNLIISALMGVAVLPLFTTIKTIVNFASHVTQLFLHPIQPEITRYHVTRKFDKIVQSMKANWFITGIILNIGFFVLMFFASDLYAIWTKGRLEFNQPLYVGMVIAVLLYNYGNSFLIYLQSINHIKGLLIVSFSRTVVLVTLIFVFVKLLGLVGVGVAFILTEIITSVQIPSYVVRQELAKFKHDIPGISRALAILPIIVVGLFFMAYQYSLPLYLIAPIVLLLLVRIIVAQWRLLSDDVQKLIYGLLPQFLRNAI